ncbi:MAG TPA: urea ABC transporter ATP-binding protein UrtD [Polyangiaceae bacterium]|nr:urea ABC transporter ATP-binding protein UrtD [Polyangiaceae bacterium]
MAISKLHEVGMPRATKNRAEALAALDESGVVPGGSSVEMLHGLARPRAHLWIDNVSVSFDGFKALTDLTMTLDKGELRCVIGPNGAGKTTLQDVITGKTRPDQGQVYLLGENREQTALTRLSEHQVAQLGIGRKFQRPTVFHGHTVFENLELALASRRGVFYSLWASLGSAQREKIDQILVTVCLRDRRDERAGRLSHGEKQWLEIGMLLALDPSILLVDEPIAGMTHQETERTAELLQSLAGKHTVVVVEHDMDFIRSIAKTVTVLHQGRVLAEGTMDKIQNDPKVIEVYLGDAAC